MEKDKSFQAMSASLTKIALNPNNPTLNSKPSPSTPLLDSSKCLFERSNPPSLVSLCLGVVGLHFEDIISDLGEIAENFPADIKMVMAGIARRRRLLNNDVILSLADDSWEILDLSGSEVSDSGLVKVAGICRSLRAVDISHCHGITAIGVSELLQRCRSLVALRCGGSPKSESTARRCLGLFKPQLSNVEGDSWEELDNTEFGHAPQSLRWLVWPKIDKDSLDILSNECPRIVVNPKPSIFGFKGSDVPREALPDVGLDDPYVKDIDPKTWVVSGHIPRTSTLTLSSPTELSVAEKFRLAFVERDTRLAPKRAKNARQHQRRAEREWVMSSTQGKALALASKASKSLHSRRLDP